MLSVKGSAGTVFFRERSNEVFHILYIPKESRDGDHVFFLNVQNLMSTPEVEQKNQKNYCF